MNPKPKTKTTTSHGDISTELTKVITAAGEINTEATKVITATEAVLSRIATDLREANKRLAEIGAWLDERQPRAGRQPS